MCTVPYDIAVLPQLGKHYSGVKPEKKLFGSLYSWVTLTKIVFFSFNSDVIGYSVWIWSGLVMYGGDDIEMPPDDNFREHLVKIVNNSKTTLLNSYALSRASQSCHIITGNDYFVSVSCSVVDPDPYSGAFRIRIHTYTVCKYRGKKCIMLTQIQLIK